MFKKSVISVLVLSFLFVGFSPVLAKTTYRASSVSLAVTVKTPVSTATPGPVNSYEMFWPMVAGKTMQSKLYFLKIWKEKIRGFFIFGSAQKADYDVFLGIKRMLEAESLMRGNVPDLAKKTLGSAADDLDKAISSLNSAKNSSDIDQGTKDEINQRRDNLKSFVNFLINQYPGYKSDLQSILDKLNSITV